MADWIGDLAPKKPSTPTPTPEPAAQRPAYDPMDPSTGIGGRVDPAAATNAFGHLAEEPHDATTSSTLDADIKHLRFDSVATRPTLPQRVDVTNIGRSAVGMKARIEGRDASVFAMEHRYDVHGRIVQPETSNRLPEQIGVSYRPLAKGSHEAVLVIRGEGMSPIRVRLEGHAMESARDGSGSSPRQEALAAADDVASLAATAAQIAISGDLARDNLGTRLLAAGGALNARIVQWVADEGASLAHGTERASQTSGAGELIKFLMLQAGDKVIGAMAMANPVSAAAMIAVDLGWSMVEAELGNREAGTQRGATIAHLGNVGAFAGNATDDVTHRLMQQYASLISSYEVAKAELMSTAGEASMTAVRGLGQDLESLQQHPNQGPAPAVFEARGVVEKFQNHKARFEAIVRMFAAEALQAGARASGAFSQLMEKYLRFRAGGHDTSKAHERAITIKGYLNYEAPRPVGLSQTRLGDVDAAELSPMVAHHATKQPLAAMRDWSVTIELDTSTGAITLWQMPDGTRMQVISDREMAKVERLGGIPALWRAVDAARLGR